MKRKGSKSFAHFPPPPLSFSAPLQANSTSATFLRVVGSELIQKYLGDGPKLVRELFKAADEMAPSIVFIDEVDAIGTKRYDSQSGGEREIQRTMLEVRTLSFRPFFWERCSDLENRRETERMRERLKRGKKTHVSFFSSSSLFLPSSPPPPS